MTEIKAKVLSEVIKKRLSNTHKGDYGRVLLIGGSQNYGGAIIMAAEGALNAGSGLVTVATDPLNLLALHARNPEVMYISWQDEHLIALIKNADVIVCGPGLGTENMATSLLKTVKSIVTDQQVVVLDASALTLIAQDRSLLPTNCQLILTPHQMEWQRLSKIKIPLQTDSANLAALKDLVPTDKVTLVLKSNHTHVYKNGAVFVNPLGNAGMATAGMGDVLAGIVGGFCAQFGARLTSILAAVYIHSLAGDEVAKTDYWVRPTKLAQKIPQLMKKYAN